MTRENWRKVSPYEWSKHYPYCGIWRDKLVYRWFVARGERVQTGRASSLRGAKRAADNTWARLAKRGGT